MNLQAVQKLCIWNLDDVHNADQESAELIHHIVQAKIPLVFMITFTDENVLPRELRSLLPNATRIQLTTFTEAQTAEYVAETLHRDKDYILPLVAVVQEKSHGNLFYIREILDTCTFTLVQSGRIARLRSDYNVWRTTTRIYLVLYFSDAELC